MNERGPTVAINRSSVSTMQASKSHNHHPDDAVSDVATAYDYTTSNIIAVSDYVIVRKAILKGHFEQQSRGDCTPD